MMKEICWRIFVFHSQDRSWLRYVSQTYIIPKQKVHLMALYQLQVTKSPHLWFVYIPIKNT